MFDLRIIIESGTSKLINNVKQKTSDITKPSGFIQCSLHFGDPEWKPYHFSAMFFSLEVNSPLAFATQKTHVCVSTIRAGV